MKLKNNKHFSVFLLILLVIGTSVFVFFDGRQNYEITLFLQLLTGLVSGLVFGRRREKHDLLFLLIGAVLLALWTSLLSLFSLPPPGYLLEVARFLGVHRTTVLRRGIAFNSKTRRVTKADLARQICI